MNPLVKLVILLGLLCVIVYLLSTLAGLLFWIVLLGALLGGILAMVRRFLQVRQSRKSDLIADRRAERHADRVLQDLERKANKQ